MQRRSFVTGAVAALSAQSQTAAPVRIGIDLFSIRSSGWTPFEYLDYCAKLKANVAFISEVRFLGSLEEAHVRKVREHADKLGLALELGMRSICPTSKAFEPAQGTAEEQITRMIAASKIAGSPVIRAFLGTMADRTGPTPLDGHIENTVRVLKNVRSRLVDAGLKVAIENHAGDMQARELKSLVDAAGTDICGVCLDSGNPLWTIEDPHLTLETLAPYTLTSGVRDTALWRVPEGVAVQWVRMGEGDVRIDEYLRTYAKLCPGKTISLEIIVTQPRVFRTMDAKFWEPYRKTPAWEFARFLSLAEAGKARPASAPVPKEQAPAKEREDLEASLRYVQKFFGQ